MPVYLARFGALGPVKIGCSMNVAARLDHLGSRLWDTIHLLRLLDGDMKDERALHERFAAQCIRGEWFHYVPEMMGNLGLVDLQAEPGRALSVLEPRFFRDKDRRAVSEGLRDWMVKRGLDEHSLAKLLGCSRGTVGGWLRYGWTPQLSSRKKLIELSNGELEAPFAAFADARRHARLDAKASRAPEMQAAA